MLYTQPKGEKINTNFQLSYPMNKKSVDCDNCQQFKNLIGIVICLTVQRKGFSWIFIFFIYFRSLKLNLHIKKPLRTHML